MKIFKRILISFISAFILTYLSFTILNQLFNRNDTRGKGNLGGWDWICNVYGHRSRCDFREFTESQVSLLDFLFHGAGVISIPVFVIIYLGLTHRERVHKK